MGLLPEIDRAWVSIDHRLLLWDWADGSVPSSPRTAPRPTPTHQPRAHAHSSSFSTFEELSDVIVGVALVRPRPGVFVDSIAHILVLATPSSVTLVGLGYTASESDAKKEVTFFLTGLSVPTDGVSFTTIRGTPSGRIFLSSSPDPLTPGGIGGDGALHELVYQAQEGWFAKRCTLNNITGGGLAKSVVPSFLRSLSATPQGEWIVSFQLDSERGLLYTLLRNSTIEMYQLPSSSPGKFDGVPTKVAKTGDLARQAAMLLPNNPMLKTGSAFRLVALEVVSVREGGAASKIALVAVTSTGVRLYFSHQRRGYYYGAGGSTAALELAHVRPPPAPQAHHGQGQAQGQGQGQGQGQQIPFNAVMHAQHTAGGLFLAANNLTPDLDVLLVCAPDLAASHPASSSSSSAVISTGQGGPSSSSSSSHRPYTELAGTVEIPGRTWDLAEVTPRPRAALLNELATQPTHPRREWVVLTNMGASVVARQRPVDTLLDVLEGVSMSGGGGHGEIGVFFERCVFEHLSFSPSRGLARCLARARGRTPADPRAPCAPTPAATAATSRAPCSSPSRHPTRSSCPRTGRSLRPERGARRAPWQNRPRRSSLRVAGGRSALTAAGTEVRGEAPSLWQDGDALPPKWQCRHPEGSGHSHSRASHLCSQAAHRARRRPTARSSSPGGTRASPSTLRASCAPSGRSASRSLAARRRCRRPTCRKRRSAPCSATSSR